MSVSMTNGLFLRDCVSIAFACYRLNGEAINREPLSLAARFLCVCSIPSTGVRVEASHA